MNVKRALQLAFILVTSVALSDLFPPVSQARANAERLEAVTQQAQSAAPRITKAELVKKTLTIEGENFTDGAKLLVNGERVKSFNDELTPTAKIVVNKANKRLPIDEAVRLQVQNVDGQISEPFGLFTGLTFTANNTTDGLPAYVSIGRKFLIYFHDERTFWMLYFPPSQSRPVVEYVTSVTSIIPDSQGVFIAQQVGYAPFWMQGEVLGERPFRYLVNLNVVE